MEVVTNKTFGIFVGLYNKLTNQKLSVKQALAMPAVVALFNETALNTLQASNKIIPILSTKRRSFEKTDASKRRKQVLEFVRANPGVSRQEIAEGTGLLLQSICGRVSELLAENMLQITGEKTDERTQRQVEILSALEQKEAQNG